ncbi:MAG: AI-2E family transporter [Ruminococcaceae bacterium]|nr:AI-2E family transporter [Oscillospiraceae bacterium]
MLPFKPKKQYTLIAIYASVTIAVAILFGVALFYLRTIGSWISNLISALSPLLYALMIAYLTRPLVVRFEGLYRKLLRFKQQKDETKKERLDVVIRLISIASSFILLSSIILSFSLFVVPLLLGDTKLLGERLVQLAERLVELANSLGSTFGFHLSADKLLDFLQGSRTVIMNALTEFGTAFAMTVFEILVGVCVSVSVLYYRGALAASVRRFGAAVFSFKVFRYLEKVVFYSNRVFGKYLIGKIVECSIVGLIYLIVLPIMGVPYPFLITIVMTITNFIPIIGAILGGIPCGILILTGENPILALWFAILVLAIEQLDGNIIFPKVIGSIIDLRAVWIMIAVALFGGSFGIIGMFLSPPLFSIIYMLLRDGTNHRLEKKGQPTATDYYTDLFATTAPPRKRKLKYLFFLGERDHEENDHQNKR